MQSLGKLESLLRQAVGLVLWASVSIERLTPETSQHPRRVHSPQVLQDLAVDVRCSARQGVVEILAASGLVGQLTAPLGFGSLEDLGHERLPMRKGTVRTHLPRR